jgi:N-acetylmuramic acid 6-phosphate etherase
MKKNEASTLELAEEFLSVASEFKLGSLPTESPHPKSINLSRDAKENLPIAIATIKEIDEDVFKTLQSYLPELVSLKNDIADTIQNGGKIFLCGCGATGRLSLALETIWRIKYKDHELENRTVSFMAGGDVALIHSVEKFEDFPEFGERQLRELNFAEGDLLISCTEGGETPFVIGATEAALNISKRSPYFLYCNPDDILIKTAERSKRVIENKRIHKINLSVGPMALTGSTRMQATTILMYAAGLCLWFYDQSFNELEKELGRMLTFVQKTDFTFLKEFIEKESSLYEKGEYLFYETDGALGISILTDTTERSPTFSLYPFENQLSEHKNPSLSYLLFPESSQSESAWLDLLKRKPRTFHWKEVTDQTSDERLVGFDFSRNLLSLRPKYLKARHSHFKITLDEEKNVLNFELEGIRSSVELGELNFLSAHLVLKILLNNLSTLIMGRMNRYESNLMTWVRASNNKLVDRACRYVNTLLLQKGIVVSYEELVQACFRIKDQIPRDQSLVLTMVDEFSGQKKRD